jgi:hypothetical protein
MEVSQNYIYIYTHTHNIHTHKSQSSRVLKLKIPLQIIRYIYVLSQSSIHIVEYIYIYIYNTILPAEYAIHISICYVREKRDSIKKYIQVKSCTKISLFIDLISKK